MLKFLYSPTAILLLFVSLTMVSGDDPKSQLELAYDQSDWRQFEKRIPQHRPEIDQMLSHGEFGYLHACVMSGQSRIAKTMIDNEANVDLRDQQGRTPLMIYSPGGNGRADTYHVLLRSGADLDARDKDGNTPLHIQSANCSLDNVFLLLEAEADPNSTNELGQTPLHLVAESKHPWAACAAELLLNAEADSSAKTAAGKTPLDIVQARDDQPAGLLAALQSKKYDPSFDLSKDPSKACRSGAVGMLKIELMHNPKLTQWNDANGFNMLHVAAIHGHSPVLGLLIGQRLDVNQPVRSMPNSPSGGGSAGSTALQFACRYGHAESVALLVESKANVNVLDRVGDTPLHAACASTLPSIEIVSLLFGSRIKLRQNNHGESPLHALVRGAGRVIDGAKTNPKFYDLKADFETRKQIALLLIKKKHPVDMVNTAGNTPLHQAAEAESVSFVKWLLQKKANPRQMNRSGRTPFDLSQNADVQNAFRGR